MVTEDYEVGLSRPPPIVLEQNRVTQRPQRVTRRARISDLDPLEVDGRRGTSMS